ncbi:MAG: M20/M25/M40 family metallo-hydrolase [Lachnospiraceae bacterium]|nr:M20/M25/M40 family metallo-hydrolase [Lachnospiraceae bacterium]
MKLLLILPIAAGIILAVCALLLLAALVRTLLTPSKVSSYKAPEADERAMGYARKLSEMIRCETVSHDGMHETEKFLAFHKVLEELFPLVHRELEKTQIDGNLLFYWAGKDHSRPLVLMSHQDVVPAEGEWIHDPFSGDIADGKVWGRGASDTKCSVMGFFQAAEELLSEGYVPPVDVYLSSSCTEEWMGDGCPKLVDELERRGVRPWLVVDEGGGIITDPVGGIKGNFAMAGVFEKGKADIKLKAKSNGGHASAPSAHSPIARLSAFVNEIETKNPFRRKMLPEVQSMFETLAPYASFPLKLVFGNMWLFKPLLLIVMPKISAQAGAMLRTTIAFTMQSGSDAYNVMPQEATLGANMRFIPHQGMEESIAVIRKLADKHSLDMEVMHAVDPSESVDIHGEAFGLVQRVIGETFPGLPGSPYVMTGATDARFYQKICDNVVRFAPVIYGPEQMKGMHGLNENIEYNCLPGCVDFYKNLIRAM